MNPHFREILAALSAEKVEFLIVGAYALGAQGLPRATGDLDVWVRPTPENAKRVWQGLLRFRAPLSSMNESDFVNENNVFRMGRPPNQIDILMSVSGLTFDEAWANRVACEIEGVNVFVLAAKDQIRNKRASGRPKDLVDADWLERHKIKGETQS